MKVLVVGCGLIGGSIARCFKASGHEVSVIDKDLSRQSLAIEKGFADQAGDFKDYYDIAFVATPVGEILEVVRKLCDGLPKTSIVTDVGGVKKAIVNKVTCENFIGGHPMAGSELHGLLGANERLFEGASWVLTPTEHTNPELYSKLHNLIKTQLKAQPIALPPDVHDELVSVVSHLPHLLAAILLNLASQLAQKEPSILRLAAGGFRDITRVASGFAGIWPDIFVANKDAIIDKIDSLISLLTTFKSAINENDKGLILSTLENASHLRAQLPAKLADSENVTAVVVLLEDRPGALADVLEVARVNNINVIDLEIKHVLETHKGLLNLYVKQDNAALFVKSLSEKGYTADLSEL